MHFQNPAQRLAGAMAEGGLPVTHRIVENIWVAVVDGTLATGERLPTSRQLAVALGVSPRVVERAYAQLERRGVLATRPGEGTFVALASPSEEERERHRRFLAVCRRAIQDAGELGFGLEDLLETLADHRTMESRPPSKEPAP